MRHMLSMKLKKGIIRILIVQSSTVYKKYVTGAIQMEGAILVVLLMMALKYKLESSYFG